MNTELEDRLRADMDRFTRDIYVPRGLALKAHRRRQKRRTTLRVAMTAGTATALAVGIVAIAGAAGAFGSAPTPPAQTTAYVLRQVESALAPGSVDNLISVNRLVFSSGVNLEPAAGGGLTGGPATRGAGSPRSIAYLLHWAYRDTQKYSAYSPSGQHVFDMGVSVAKGAATEIVVNYANRTWWTATKTVAGGRSPGCVADSIQLAGGPGEGWPAFIRSQLSCGAYTVAGHQVVSGVDAIKITGDQGQPTLLVNPATYLPIQLTIGPLHNYFQWLPPTSAHLAQLKQAVPTGFQQVPPPAPN